MNKWKNPEIAVPLATDEELDFYRETEQYELVLDILFEWPITHQTII
jgi:hypothetical protein